MRKEKLGLLLLILIAVAVFYYFGGAEYFSFERLQQARGAMVELFRDYPLLFCLGFFAIYVAITGLSLPGAAVITLAGGAILGFWPALVIVSFASTFGACGAFLLSRYIFRDWVESRYKYKNLLERINRGIARDGAYYLFTLRLIPIFPFFVINAAVGLTRMRLRTFYWVSQIGMLAGTAVYVNVGTQLAKIKSPAGIISPGMLLAFVILGLFPLAAKFSIESIRRRRRYRGFSRPKSYDYNLLVIGAGSAGLVASYLGSALGAKTALVEKDRMGGDCLNTGCVPSKALIHATRLIAQIRDAERYGLGPVEARFDFGEIMEHVRRVVEEVAPHDSVERYTQLGVDCYQGEARFVDPWRVTVGQRELTARQIIVATGGRPHIPDIKGLVESDYVTSDTVWALRQLPGRLIVVGGGPIGCELAQCFARLGSRVTILQHGERLLPREDPDAAEHLLRRFQREGIDVRTGAETLEVLDADDMPHAANKPGRILRYRSSRGEVELPFDKMLLAVGRRANTEGLGLEKIDVQLNQRDGTVAVDEYTRTACPNVFACGDVAGPYQFTHMAAHQAWHAVMNAMFGQFKRFEVDYSIVPWCTFTDPPIARVGLNEKEAKSRKVPYEVTRYDLAELDRAIADRQTDGFVKVLTPPGKDTVLGATIVGSHAGEMIGEFVAAMKNKTGLNRILGTIHVYPTWSEMNKAAAGTWRKNHKPRRLLKWLAAYFAWLRR